MKRIVPIAVLLFLAAAIAWWLLADEGTSTSTPPSANAQTKQGATAPGTAAATAPPRPLDEVDERARKPTTDASDSGTAVTSATSESADAGTPESARDAIRRRLEQNAKLAEKYVDRFCEESKQIHRPPPTSRTQKKDASSFLTVRIDWEDNTRPPGLLHLPEAVRQRIKSYGSSWPTMITEADYASRLETWRAWQPVAELAQG